MQSVARKHVITESLMEDVIFSFIQKETYLIDIHSRYFKKVYFLNIIQAQNTVEEIVSENDFFKANKVKIFI